MHGSHASHSLKLLQGLNLYCTPLLTASRDLVFVKIQREEGERRKCSSSKSFTTEIKSKVESEEPKYLEGEAQSQSTSKFHSRVIIKPPQTDSRLNSAASVIHRVPGTQTIALSECISANLAHYLGAGEKTLNTSR